MVKKGKKRSRKKPVEEKKNTPVLMILIGVMVVGTVAGGFLFSRPSQNDDVALPEVIETPDPVLNTIPNITLRHNPVNTTITQVVGGQLIEAPVTYNDTHIMVDMNPRLAGKTLIFNITMLNVTKGNGTAPGAEAGDAVGVEYTGYLANGEVFDTNVGGLPLEFVVGSGGMIKGFDDGVRGMVVNETKTASIPPEDAYGSWDPENVQVIPRYQKIPKTMTLSFPMTFELPLAKFIEMFGTPATAGDVIFVSELNANARVLATGENVTMQTLISPGDTWKHPSFPWNSTVLWVLGNEIGIEHQAVVGRTYQFEGMPWNTTVVSVG